MTGERRPPPRRRVPEAQPHGYAGRPLPVRRPYQSRYAGEMDDGAGAAGGRLAGMLLALAVAALVLTHGLWQVTAPGPAGRVLRSVLPQLTDLDQTLAANLNVLRELAAGQPPDGRVTVPGLPVPVQVTRDEAESDPAALRATVLRRMSESVYQQGPQAFRAPGSRAPDPTILSSQWALQRTLDSLTAGRHDALRFPRLAAIALTVLLAVLTIWLMEGPARLTGPGVSIIAGSILGGLFALGMRVFAILFYGEDEVGDAIVRLVARDTSTTLLYVAGSFLVFGVIVTVLGALARRWDQAQPSLAPVDRREALPRRRGE